MATPFYDFFCTIPLLLLGKLHHSSEPEPLAPTGEGWQEKFIGGSEAAENQHFEAFAQQIKKVQTWNHQKGEPMQRALHAKMHVGVMNAQLVIDENIPEDLRHGIFQPGHTYKAAVRLSNAASKVASDHKKDLRGLGVRVFVNDEPEQFIDLLMTNAPASHARDAKQFMGTLLAVSGPKVLIPFRLLGALGLSETLRIGGALRRDRRVISSLATEAYWSRGPFQLGSKALQFFARPAAETEPNSDYGDKADPNFLRTEFQVRLRHSPVVYDLMAQLFVDEAKTPIENGAKRWETTDSPPIKIAQLIIPPQDLNTPAAIDAAGSVQQMGLNPWNSLGATLFKPLGGLNRGRKPVYQASAAFREEGSRAATESRCPFFRLTVAFVRFIERALTWTNQWGMTWSKWAKIHPILGVLNLIQVRRVLREKNLHDTETLASRESYEQQYPSMGGCPVMKLAHRSADGSYNDLSNPHMGRAGTRFGRNFSLSHIKQAQDNAKLLEPNPRTVAQTLMTRSTFQPVPQLNLLAAAWIQFMVHGWVFHEADDTQRVEIAIDEQDRDWPGPRPMQVFKTKVDPLSAKDPVEHPTAFINRESHWWDASQIYGSSQAIQDQVRSHQDGKLHIDERGLLPTRTLDTTQLNHEIDALEQTGLTENWWLGLGLLHSLFTLEHNAICDHLKAEYPRWNDEQLFQTARLVNSALLAKIHTIEWSPAILKHPTLEKSFNTNWWGLFGERLQGLVGKHSTNEIVHGQLGFFKELSGVPYSLTEEFTSVYRLHTLLPDELVFRSIADGHRIENLDWLEQSHGVALFTDVMGPKARTFMEKIEFSDLLYSFGLMNPGATALHNYPNFLRTLEHNGNMVDLAAVEIYRDRERGVPRYNDFRRQLRMKPADTFAELVGGDKDLAQQLASVYTNIEEVDLQVGLMAERPLPRGFGFSDTAFRLFILMAARRLNCDRFFTTDYNPETYSPAGWQWLQDNTMKTVLLRHFPQLEPALRLVENVFAPWNRVGEP
jgi:hypothetical protein